jgi:hypothetical protein
MKEDRNSYNPITLVPGLSKILEKVITNQVICFLEKTQHLINLSLDLGKINSQNMLLPQL